MADLTWSLLELRFACPPRLLLSPGKQASEGGQGRDRPCVQEETRKRISGVRCWYCLCRSFEEENDGDIAYGADDGNDVVASRQSRSPFHLHYLLTVHSHISSPAGEGILRALASML
eukprot:764597-Hanusia_phi.AAC.2